MKFSLIIGIIAGLIVPACSKAQGTTYFSNLGNPSTSSIAVGSDSWNGASFVTGTNANGYTLRSVQLLMGNAIGSPSGFAVSLYSANLNGPVPDTILGNMTGSDPTTQGVYTYTSPNLSLQSLTRYFIVVTSATPVSTGNYVWNIGSGGSMLLDGWRPGGDYLNSTDGTSWSAYRPNPFQYAINATAVPEPATSSLIAIGVLALGLCRRKTWRQDIESRAC